MPATNWFNENANRQYPFDIVGPAKVGAYTLPKDFIVDASFLLGGYAKSNADATVWLYKLETSGANTVLRFRFTQSGLAQHEFVFTIPVSSPRYTTFFVDATPVTGPVVANVQYGTAFLVIDTVPSGVSATAPTPVNSTVFSSLVQTQKDHYVWHLNLANDPDATFLPCGSPPIPISEDLTCPTATIMAQDITGTITLVEGYNARIDLSPTDRKIYLGAYLGAGDGQPCKGVSRYPSGDLPDAPNCGELVYTINGMPPDGSGLFTIRGDKGIAVDGLVVTPDPIAVCEQK